MGRTLWQLKLRVSHKHVNENIHKKRHYTSSQTDFVMEKFEMLCSNCQKDERKEFYLMYIIYYSFVHLHLHFMNRKTLSIWIRKGTKNIDCDNTITKIQYYKIIIISV